MGKVLILLALVLALANARCFAHCVVQPCGSEATHCHPQGHANAGQCSHQHDMMTATATSVPLTDGVQFVQPATIPARNQQPIQVSVNVLDPSPPQTSNLIPPLPLRV